MERALAKLASLQDAQQIGNLQALLSRIDRMPGAHSLFRRIAFAGEDEVADHWAAICYAAMFAGLGFDVAVEPAGKEGPDLLVCRDGYSTTVEVTRFRKMHDGLTASGPADMPNILLEYGDPLRDIRKVRDKVIWKFGKLHEGTAILAIWNDDGDLEELEACQGVAEIAHDIETGVLAAPPDVFLVIYASEWLSCRQQQQVYCFELRPELPDYQRRWAKELASSCVQQLLQQALSLQ